MNYRRFIFVIFFMTLSLRATASDLLVLNYHDVVANPGDDRFAVSRALLIAHLDFLHQNGYRPIALEQLEAAIEHHTALPDKAVLLTFDDGLKSYREFVAPVLEIYGYPSVVSVVTGWLDGINVPHEYEGRLMSWDDLRALAKQRQVSIITHSHNLHHGITANPQNNVRSAATTRQYLADVHAYEDEPEFRRRIRDDLETSLQRLKSELGITPTAVAWPYGEYDEVVLGIARDLKLKTHFVLADGFDHRRDEGIIGRVLVVDRPKEAEFERLVLGPTAPHYHFVEFSLDAFAGADAVQQEQMLSALLDQLQTLKVNAVITTPVTSDGNHALFATRTLNTATNILDRVLHQIRVRLNVRTIVLRIPARLQVRDAPRFFTDLARTTRFNGVLFERDTPSAWQVAARATVPIFRANTRFGVVGGDTPSSNYDFVVVPANTESTTLGDPGRLWYLDSGTADVTARQALEDKLTAQGISNFGFTLDGNTKHRESRPFGNDAMRKGG